MSHSSREEQLAEFKDRLATAQAHRVADRMELARGEYVQSLAFAEQHFGPDSPQVDEVCLELALFYSTVKEPAAELAVLERRVRIRKAQAGIPQIVEALQDVAECHKLQDRPDEAESTYREAMDLCDESIEAHHPALRMTLLYFGMFLNERERHADAVQFLESAFDCCKLPAEVPTLTAARITMHLGEALLHLKRHAEARTLIDAATPVVTHRGQPGSTVFGKIFYYLGNYHQREERFLEAARAYDLALLQSRNARYINFRNMAYIQQAAAANDLKRGRPRQAEQRLKVAVNFLCRTQDEHHPDVLSVKQDLVNIYIPAKQYAKAEPLLEEMVAASDHPDFDDERAKERYLNNLGFVQVHLEEFPKAEANLRRALLSAGEDHGCYVIKNLGLMYQKMGYASKAIQEYRRALPLFEQHLSTDHPVAEFIRGALAELEGNSI
jgi:tetratricopeptide (TPR) repeat protein